MTVKMFFRSLMHIRNLGLLAVVLILYSFTGWMPLFFVGFAVYFALVLQKAYSPKFRQNFNRMQSIKKLRRLNHACMNSLYSVKRKVSKDFASRIIGKVSSILGIASQVDLEARVNKVACIKDEIFNAFFMHERSNIKERIVFKAMELADIYFRLMEGYASRFSDVSVSNLSNLDMKIQNNRRKLNMSSNSHYADDLRQAIETDERLLQRLREERQDVEKMGAKLNVIESTMLLLKQQYFAETQSDEVVEDIENTINEATALDNALYEHKKNKRGIQKGKKL